MSAPFFKELPILQSTATVGAAATFSQPKVDADGFDEVSYFCRANAAGGMLRIYGNTEPGGTMRELAEITIPAGDPATKGSEKLEGVREVSVRFENGANAQNPFEIRAKLKRTT